FSVKNAGGSLHCVEGCHAVPPPVPATEDHSAPGAAKRSQTTEVALEASFASPLEGQYERIHRGAPRCAVSVGKTKKEQEVERQPGNEARLAHIKKKTRSEHSRLNCSVPWVRDCPAGFQRGRRDRCPIRT